MGNILQVNRNSGTLLGNFVDEKVLRYVEPSREGTPRGETIGFSAVKYGASLYGLTNYKQKQIAENLKISHGLLRKWHTEEPFKEAVDKHCREFSEVFIKNMWEKYRTHDAKMDSYKALPLSEISSTDLPHMDWNDISDARLYSDRASLYIAIALEAEPKKQIAKEDYLLMVYNEIDVLRYFQGDKKSKELVAQEAKLKRMLLKSLLDSCIEIAQKPNLSKKDKVELLTTLKVISQGGG